MNRLMMSCVISIGWIVTGQASATVVRHFDAGRVPGRFKDVSTLLTHMGIGARNINSETIATSFKVPGMTGTRTDLTFKMERDTGGFRFSFGFFDLAKVSSDPVIQKQAWAMEALSEATLVFDDRVDNVGTMSLYSVDAGRELGFFLIPNNTLGAFQADPGSFYPSQTGYSSLRSPLFSQSSANPGEADQMLSFVGNGVTLFTFEDLTRTGRSDQDFTDLGFSIDMALQPTVTTTGIPEPASAALGLMSLGGMSIYLRRRRRPTK